MISASRWRRTNNSTRRDGSRDVESREAQPLNEAAHATALAFLDWRYPLDAKCEPFDLDSAVAARLRDLLADLKLRMGIFDLKFDAIGDPVWLEVNPRGQSLFLEDMCGLPLTKAFADFRIREARP